MAMLHTVFPVVLATLGALVSPVFAQDAHTRWAELDPTRRAELQERFERFRELPQETRDLLVERARGLGDRIREAEARMSPAELQALRDLSPAERRDALRDLVRERLRFHGRMLRESLPDELRTELEGAAPWERPMILERHRASLRERISDRFLERAGPELGLDQAFLEELRGLPAPERAQRLRERMSGRPPLSPSPQDGRPPEPWPRPGRAPFDFLDADQARELLELGRPRLEDVLAPREARQDRASQRILDAAAAMGLPQDAIDELSTMEPSRLLLRLRRTASGWPGSFPAERPR